MDNVIQFPKQPVMIKGWDFACAVLRQGGAEGAKECQDLLDSGYEPFSVTSYQEFGGKDLVTGQPKIALVEKIWMKRPAAPVPERVEPLGLA